MSDFPSCNCEHEFHAPAYTCENPEANVRARYVGNVCSSCAATCMKDEIVAWANVELAEDVDDISVVHVYLMGEHYVKIATFYGWERYENARVLMKALYVERYGI